MERYKRGKNNNMSYINPFNSIIQTTKKNNIFFGPTQSTKMASFLSEVRSDMDTLFSAVNNLSTAVDALSSAYFSPSPSGNMIEIDYIRRSLRDISGRLEAIIYVQGTQPAIL